MKNFTLSIRAMVLCIMLSALMAPSRAQQIEKSLVTSTGERIGFLEYKPAEYATEGDVKHPVIIFLHGIGERGNGTTDLRNVARIGLPQMLRDGFKARFTWNGKTETFLVVSPQCPTTYGMWPIQMVGDFVEYVKKNLKVDTNRIYLTGLSMGGGGSNRYISNSTAAPAKLAATATICTPCTFSNGSFVAKANMPYWAFHAADDYVALASCTEKAVNAINSANPKVKPLKTIWPTGGHAVWDRVYKDTNYVYDGVINIYEWFLGQNKSLPLNTLPVANAGADMRISPRQTSVVLDASASSDADGKLVRYVWKKISGPVNGTIASKMSGQPTTTVSGLKMAGVYQYELAVVDDRAGVSRDTVTITVAADAPLPIPSDNVVSLPKPADTLVVNPRPTDSIVLQPKPADTLVIQPAPADTVVAPKPTPADPVVSQPKPADPVVIQPKPSTPVEQPKPAEPSRPVGNKAPIARTTGDIVIPIEWNWWPNVSAYPSSDEDGYIARVTWKKISGPGACHIESPNAVKTTLSKLVPGVYIFRATVYDDKGASDYSDLKVSISYKGVVPSNGDTANLPPVARTTPDIVVPIEWKWWPNISAYPSTDADGYIAKVTWSKISGPDAYTIESPNSVRTTVSDLVPGVYVFRTTVYDNKGAFSTADVKVTITQKAPTSTVASSAVLEETAVSKTPVTVLSMPSQLTLAPNPATNMINLQYNSASTGNSVIRVFDAMGKTIKSIAFNKAASTYTHKLDISQLTGGVYYVQVQTGANLQLQSKFVKN